MDNDVKLSRLDDAVKTVNNAFLRTVHEKHCLLPMQPCPYTKQCLSQAAGISFTKKDRINRKTELEVDLVSKDNKIVQILYKGIIVHNKALFPENETKDVTGNSENAYYEYAKYLLNKDKPAKEIRKHEFEMPDRKTLHIPALSELLKEEPEIKNNPRSDREELETKETKKTDPECEPILPEVILTEETFPGNNRERHCPLVDECISKVSDICTVSLKLNPCPYQQVFYPWINEIEFSKGENGVIMIAKGIKEEHWDYKKTLEFVGKYNEERTKTLKQVLEIPGKSVFHAAKEFADAKIAGTLRTGQPDTVDLKDGTRIAFIPLGITVPGSHDLKDRICSQEIDSLGNVLEVKTFTLLVNIKDGQTKKWTPAYQEFWNNESKEIHCIHEDEISDLYRTIAGQLIQEEKFITQGSRDKDQDMER